MTREEKLKECQKIQDEIQHLKTFEKFLGYEHTISQQNRFSKILIKREIEVKKTFNFLGIFKSHFGGPERIDAKIIIPDKMILEINALVLQWIEELERRADEILIS